MIRRYRMWTDFFGLTKSKKQKELDKINRNEASFMMHQKKKNIDDYLEAKIAMKNEKDPKKKERMRLRILNGIYDFSDI